MSDAVQGVTRPDDPLHAGHRDRLRQRFNAAGDAGVADYELLELLLFRSLPRRDVKPLAKTMMARFGSFAERSSRPGRSGCARSPASAKAPSRN